jgi:hypothetical protein
MKEEVKKRFIQTALSNKGGGEVESIDASLN